eukprot:TRINITY_DN33269_c0_g1_i1.p1 TRINITY_DN33269_c0_g1~~TRINITY_DN33269_c0_g1_i1.p1  ORF type:complete len:105 (-),score=12.06 TRINITY_DN33269_c0_g1_i1:266-580(-)
MQFHSEPLKRLTMWCCGPRTGRNACPSGARTNSPDCHVSLGVYLAGVLPHHPEHFKTTHKSCNMLDSSNPGHINAELLQAVETIVDDLEEEWEDEIADWDDDDE